MADTLVVIAELLGASQEQLAGITGGFNEAGAASSTAFDQVATDLSETLPAAAEEGNARITEAFAGTSEAVQEGLGPVVDKFETEIKGAGQTTSEVIRSAFGSANQEIQSGLSNIEGTIGTGITGAAEKAAGAVLGIADAAREAARAAEGINLPGGGGPISADVGFNGLLQRDTLIQAHEGELVNILPAAKVRSMKSQGTLASAQAGAGGFTVQMGDTNINIPGGVVQTDRGAVVEGLTLEDLKRALREDREDIVEEFRKVMFEQT